VLGYTGLQMALRAAVTVLAPARISFTARGEAKVMTAACAPIPLVSTGCTVTGPPE